MNGTKPLAKLRLKFVNSFCDRHGKVRHYFRKPGHKSVRLPGLPGSAEFMDAYQAALAGVTISPPPEIGAARCKPGSVATAVATYFGSHEFGHLADATKYDRRRILERFREDHGEKNFAGLAREHIEIMLDEKAAKPYAARSFLKALRHLTKVAIRSKLRADDPTIGISMEVSKTETDGFQTWTEDNIAKFEAAYPIGRLTGAAGLRLGTLYRPAPRRHHPHGPPAY
jgi:hypothetical protein